ncbi:CPBP family intramembrane glutamic endopeptidase [Prescottella equi]
MHQARRYTAIVLFALAIATSAPLAIWLVAGSASVLAEQVGLVGDRLAVPVGWMGAALVAAGYISYTLWSVPFVREHVTEISPLKALGVWVAITSSAIEEIIFRRMVMDVLADNGIGAVGQIGASALAFGVAHGAWVLLGREWAIAIPVVVSTTCLGAGLAAVYLLSDRALLPAVIAHIAINLVIEPWLILSAVTRDWNPQHAKRFPPPQAPSGCSPESLTNGTGLDSNTSSN